MEITTLVSGGKKTESRTQRGKEQRAKGTEDEIDKKAKQVKSQDLLSDSEIPRQEEVETRRDYHKDVLTIPRS